LKITQYLFYVNHLIIIIVLFSYSPRRGPSRSPSDDDDDDRYGYDIDHHHSIDGYVQNEITSTSASSSEVDGSNLDINQLRQFLSNNNNNNNNDDNTSKNNVAVGNEIIKECFSILRVSNTTEAYEVLEKLTNQIKIFALQVHHAIQTLRQQRILREDILAHASYAWNCVMSCVRLTAFLYTFIEPQMEEVHRGRGVGRMTTDSSSGSGGGSSSGGGGGGFGGVSEGHLKGEQLLDSIRLLTNHFAPDIYPWAHPISLCHKRLDGYAILSNSLKETSSNIDFKILNIIPTKLNKRRHFSFLSSKGGEEEFDKEEEDEEISTQVIGEVNVPPDSNYYYLKLPSYLSEKMTSDYYSHRRTVKVLPYKPPPQESSSSSSSLNANEKIDDKNDNHHKMVESLSLSTPTTPPPTSNNLFEFQFTMTQKNTIIKFKFKSITISIYYRRKL